MVMKYKCPVCNIDTSWKKLLDNREGDQAIYYCQKCELRMLYPQNSDNIKQGLYDGLEKEVNFKQQKLADKSVRFYKKIIKRVISSDCLTLLDVGAGLGYYSKAFAKEGYAVTYIDGDYESYSFARKHQRGIQNFFCEDILEYLLKNEDKYDVIFCRHVIEHAYEPRELVDLLLSHLTERGIVILETDNNKSSEILLHPDTEMFWSKQYTEEYAVDNIQSIVDMNVTAINRESTHWWAFNASNLKELTESLGGG